MNIVEAQKTNSFSQKTFLSLIFIVFLVDVILKFLMRTTEYNGILYSIAEVKLVYNHSSFLGFLSDASPFLQRAGLSILGIYFLTLMSFFIASLWTRNFPWTRSSLIMLTAGAAGNISERIATGKITDYFSLTFISSNIYMNLVDILLIAGIVTFCVSQVIEGKRLFFDSCKRSLNLFNNSFQKTVALYSILASVLLSSSLYVIFLTVLAESHLIESFESINMVFIGTSICNCMILTIIILKVCHRSSGAIYAIERDYSNLFLGKIDNIKLRDRDFHKELAQKISNIAKENINGPIKKSKNTQD